jgi:hypothetical protein
MPTQKCESVDDVLVQAMEHAEECEEAIVIMPKKTSGFFMFTTNKETLAGLIFWLEAAKWETMKMSEGDREMH